MVNFVKFKTDEPKDVWINPANVSYVYESGKNTAIVFGGRSAQPMLVPLPRKVVMARLMGLMEPDTGD